MAKSAQIRHTALSATAGLSDTEERRMSARQCWKLSMPVLLVTNTAAVTSTTYICLGQKGRNVLWLRQGTDN